MADSKAENNVQHSLAKIEGAEKTAPIPQSNVEHYLAKIAGEDVTIPEKPNTTEEYYLENILEAVDGAEGFATAAEESAKSAAESAATAQVSVANPFVIAATAAAMADHTKAYVYTGSETGYVTGGWYYWNGTDWTLGGQATDSTLTVSGAPADAKVTGDKISDLKSAVKNDFNISMNGAGTFDPVNFGNWVRGYVDGATGIVTTLNRRICQSQSDTHSFPIHLTIKTGFQITVTYYNGSTVLRTDYGIIGEYTIPKNTSFKITIRRVTEDMSEVADFEEFWGALGIMSPFVKIVEQEIQSLNDDFDRIVDFADNPYLISEWSTISLDSILNNDGSISANVNYWTSDYITVNANTQYAMSNNANQYAVYLGKVVFLDSNKIAISAAQNIATFTTPANTVYVRLCRQYFSASGTGSAAGINSSNYLTDDYIINKSNLQKGSVGSVPKNNYLKSDIRIETWFKGRKILSYGDSIVELNKWQPYCKQYFGTDTFWNGGGVGGTTVYNNGGTITFPGTSTPVDSWMCSDARINRIQSIYGSLDCIIVLAGHNDWSESCPIGEIGTTLVDSNFKSAYALMIKKLVNAFPEKPIFCCTPINGRIHTAGVNQDVQETNQLGLTMTDYADAVIDVCRHYGIPCIDLNGETGISVLNAATYLADVIHPNNAGGKKIANAVINGMKRFEPIDL